MSAHFDTQSPYSLVSERAHGLRVSSATEPFGTTTPMGRAFLEMLATFAQLEADLASERISDSLQHLRAQRRKPGALSMVEAIGADGQRVVDPVKAGIVREIHRLRDGAMSYRQIVAHLNETASPRLTASAGELAEGDAQPV